MTASQIKARRMALKMTQAQMAKALGVTRITVTRWETGATSIPDSTIKLLESIDTAQPISQVKWQDMQLAQLNQERQAREQEQLRQELERLRQELQGWKSQLDESRAEVGVLKRELAASTRETSDVRLELLRAQLEWQRARHELDAAKRSAGGVDLLHQILGIDKRATPKEIKSAYRAWAHIHHPDKNPTRDTNTLFAAVTSAYEAALANG